MSSDIQHVITADNVSSGTAPRLRMAHVSKTFGRNKVLDDVTLEILPGEVHGLLGQNGSGKSTLIKVLSGLYSPDSGAEIEIDGVELPQPINPAGISQRGLTIIHQSLGLIPGHSVTENIRMGSLERRRFGRFIDWKYERARAVETLADMQADIDPDQLIDTLHIGQRATVAIARALQVIVPGSGCLVLDESTQSLPREVLPEFYDTLRGLAKRGTSIAIVSHRLEEVLALADRVTVLRDGAVTAAGVSTKEMSEAQLSRQILGRELISFTRDRSESSAEASATETLPETINLTDITGATVRGVSLTIAHGEIVGITGATEAGQDELPYLIAGASTERRSGTITRGKSARSVADLTVADALDSGIALVPSDRAGQGLAVELDAVSNLTLPRITKRSGRGPLRSSWQRAEFERAVEMLRITPPDPEQLVTSYSGGNQQKILLAKWLLHEPQLLVLHEPTQAVDVGARADILHAIAAAARGGAAVLLASIEAQDLSLICDRILVFEAGRIVRELHAPFAPDGILSAVE
ncbi:sugar ABC transporter ATP-binding protein [Naasia lichenicola]|nr:sugar ABC transporter ATP-binding protein [Naasia lichenicola]